MLETVFFFAFAGLAIGCALMVVLQRNPLYSAISLIGVFIALASLYLTLASPFIAAVQILVYAGAIMVLVVFVIMLLNVEEDVFSTKRLQTLPVVGAVLGLALMGQAFFIYYAVTSATNANGETAPNNATMGLTGSIGQAMFTEYLLPFEITGLLLLMAIVGAMMLSRRIVLPPDPTQLERGQDKALDAQLSGDSAGAAQKTDFAAITQER